MSPRALLRGGAVVATLPGRLRVRPVTDREARLTTVDHLDELRGRLLASVITLAAAFVAGFLVHEQLITWLNAPLEGGQPVTLGITEPFFTSLKVSAFAALTVSFPVLMWHLWRFVAPTLDEGVRRTVATYVGAGTLLMFGGVAFAYFIALPSAVSFLTSFDAHLYDVQVRAQEYYVFACAVLLSVGLVFQLPVVLLALVRFRILTHALLSGNRKIAYVSLTALAVLMPGVDPVTTTMWILPLGLMFEVSILLARRVEKRARRTEWATAEVDVEDRYPALSA